MKRLYFLSFLLLFSVFGIAQNNLSLSVKQIMKDPSWIGTAPKNLNWSENGETLFFEWDKTLSGNYQWYKISLKNKEPQLASESEKENFKLQSVVYNGNKKFKAYVKQGDIYHVNLKTKEEKCIAYTTESEFSPRFGSNSALLYFRRGLNLFVWNSNTGTITQLSNFKSGKAPRTSPKKDPSWVAEKEMEMMEVLQSRNKKKEDKKPQKKIQPIYLNNQRLLEVGIDKSHQNLVYRTYKSSNKTNTIVADHVTTSAYTTDLNARAKVGHAPNEMHLFLYKIEEDTLISVAKSDLPGLDVYPEYYSEEQKTKTRSVYFHSVKWAQNQLNTVFIARSTDNKDRWICALELSTGKLKVIDHQRDEAWISGPGIGWTSWDNYVYWLPNSNTIWFQSEKTGYSHLYTYSFDNKKIQALTSGNFEIYDPILSANGKHWFFQSNQAHPGIRNYYKMDRKGGAPILLTKKKTGNWNGHVSPNGNAIAYLYSNANTPWELYFSADGKKIEQITNSTSKTFKQYAWRTPEYVTIKARDGENIHARIYQPENPNGAAVLFVHGAGYLQNAHQWWSTYFREYMFHNLLVDKGYTVLDMDYRGSAGYGRDWRTGIYRHMGGKDLSDHLDGVDYLIQNYKIDASKVGIYGGSYGGFITLMALFKTENTFAAGAALRSVTDWAHYNHGYTSNILNTPEEDPEAYEKSSPIYFAEGLNTPLLICHGMIDTNVQFQDVVRLSQRLIELEKENWEMAVYPMEGHGFKAPSSWTDEYSRILKLFETHLK